MRKSILIMFVVLRPAMLKRHPSFQERDLIATKGRSNSERHRDPRQKIASRLFTLDTGTLSHSRILIALWSRENEGTGNQASPIIFGIAVSASRMCELRSSGPYARKMKNPRILGFKCVSRAKARIRPFIFNELQLGHVACAKWGVLTRMTARTVSHSDTRWSSPR